MVQVCPTYSATGSCKDKLCVLRHTVTYCEACQMALGTPSAFASHARGKKHRSNISGAGQVFRCEPCGRSISGATRWEQHINGQAHLSQVGRGEGVLRGEITEPIEAVLETRVCELCAAIVEVAKWPDHVSSPLHKRKEENDAWKDPLRQAERDQFGVTVSHADSGVDFGVVEVEAATEGTSIELIIKLKDPTAQAKIDAINLFSSLSTARRVPASFFIQPLDSTTPTLSPNQEKRVLVTFRQTFRGQFDDRLEITFEETALSKKFVIVRLLKASVGSRLDYDVLRPSKPYYIAPNRTRREPEASVVPGVKPSAGRAVKWVTKLPTADMPKAISSVLSSRSTRSVLSQLKTSILPNVLNANTYSRFYKTLIWVEEYRMEHDLQVYDIEKAELAKHNQYYYLYVPGLAENRPSVLTGDLILVHPHGSPRGKWFEGHVHIIRKEEVGLRFHSSFPVPARGQRHIVHFKLNRSPLRRQHQALDTNFAPERLLFPAPSHIGRTTRSQADITPFNALINDNLPQLDAVRAIVYRPVGLVPFVIFGPPGTGKTITFVESIRQVLKQNPSARILACAPSNSAADLIASRLVMLGTDQLFRYCAPSRFKDTVPDELLPFTHIDVNGHFSLPPLATVRRLRVIVSTCVSASFAYGIGLPRGHFSHIFVDEAGQATEPEVMISIKTMADQKTNVVLAGDPKQLGPIIRSSVARMLTLDISYMERLMKEDIYDERKGHGVTVVKLTQNYRSHEAILKFPNERFYRGELEPCVETKVIDSCLGSAVLPSGNFPILFHAMSGRDVREASSPSFFNIHEVQQVKAYVEALRSDRRLRVSNNEIGIIAPYHAQCQKLRTLLRPFAEDIKVGSVEEFQGQERRIFIISTVISSREYVEYDLQHTLGFVANPRRFNVAVTRAQALLIIVGDPAVLSLDPLWRSFLNYIYVNRGWRGIPISWDPYAHVRDSGGYDAEFRDLGASDMNEFAMRTAELALDGAEAVDEADANVDRPWRVVE
ncbi:P-loop containing nucleoside triphosphate hydrolase protein [Amylostereum chailletii]|nr:P-loop containing nucleoside triphosphate hydrolase protein [Amylostereum chailletii]